MASFIITRLTPVGVLFVILILEDGNITISAKERATRENNLVSLLCCVDLNIDLNASLHS